MKSALLTRVSVALLGTLLLLSSTSRVNGAECTLSDPSKEHITPELAAKYTYTEDGQYTKALNIPTYEWTPVGVPPKAVILAIHGLTLHGRTFRVLARSMAANGIAFVSMDMRGFGRCKVDENNQFSSKDDEKRKVDHEKSYEDIEAMAKLVKKNYPDIPFVAMGESLGCTFCLKLAAENPDMIRGVVLSAPAVHVNKDMYAGKGQIRQGIKAVIKPSHEVNMSSFFTDLCSNRDDVQAELKDDALIEKKLTLGALLSTDVFVDKTAKWGKSTSPNLAVLILQGSVDGCVSPKHVTDLMNNMQSTDQTLCWRGNFGHLQLETTCMRVATLDAISNWITNHGAVSKIRLQQFQQNITDAGGTVTQ